MPRWPELPFLVLWSAVQLLVVVIAVVVALGLARGWAEERMREMRADQQKLLEATAERILARLERRVEQSEESITGLVKKRTLVGKGGVLAPPQPTREAARVQKRIAEGEKLMGELSRCQFRTTSREDAMTRAQTWAEVTYDELVKLISEDAARQFVKSDGVPALQVAPAKGCDPVAAVARATVARLLGNLKSVAQKLDTY